MNGRPWTVREIVCLEHSTDHQTAQMIGKRIGRSYSAVVNKMQELGIKGIRESTDLLTQNKICEIMGIYSDTVHYWERHGLHVQRKGCFRMVDQMDLLKFLRSHPELWNANKVRDDTLFCVKTECKKWFLEKKASDPKKQYFWRDHEVRMLKKMYAEGVPLKEISAKVGHTYSATNQKVCMMRKAGWKI